LSEIGGEIEPLLPRVPHHEAVKVRLEYGHFALAEPCNPVRVLIDAGDVVTEIRKAGARHKSDISGADHRNAHEASQLLAARSIPFRPAPTFLPGTGKGWLGSRALCWRERSA
jgi:hypothetical protein